MQTQSPLSPVDTSTNEAPPSSSPPDTTTTSAAPLVAETVFGEARRQKANDLHARCLRELAHNNLGRAWNYARLAVEQDPDNDEYRRIFQNWNRFTLDERAREEARLFTAAVKAEEVGEYARAVSLLRAALRKDPEAASLHNHLGMLLATRVHDVAAAMAELQRAMDLEPSNTIYTNNYARVAGAAEPKTAERRGFFARWFGH